MSPEDYIRQINHWKREASKWKAEYHDALLVISELRRSAASSEQRQAQRSFSHAIDGRF